MKQVIKNILHFLINPLGLYRFRQWMKTVQKGIVVDVDNTLADSWPSLQQQWPSENARLLQLPLLKGTRAWLQQHYQPREMFFLSARNYLSKPATIQWLQQQGFDANSRNTVLVPDAHKKIAYLKLAAQHGSIALIDDLSFGTEKGNTQYHTDICQLALNMKLMHYDHAFIQALNSTT